MSKAQTLASTVSTGGVLADGTVAYAEVTGTPTNSATATSIAGGSVGTIPYQSAADTTAMLGVGTAGQVLQTNGAGAPTWVTPAGGAMVLLSTVTASASATVDIETGLSTTYDNYFIVATAVLTSSNVAVYCRLKIGGSYLTGSVYGYHSGNITDFAATYSALQSSSATEIRIMNGSSTAPSSFEMSIPDANASAHHAIRYLVSSRAGGLTALGGGAGVGHSSTSGVLSGIRLFPPSGTISGTFRLYGIVNS